MQELQAGSNGQSETLPATAIRAQLATVLATAALFLAVAGVVYGPGFTRNESIATQQTKTPDLLATVGAALREQSPEYLLQAL
jgi:hypothetical protein